MLPFNGKISRWSIVSLSEQRAKFSLHLLYTYTQTKHITLSTGGKSSELILTSVKHLAERQRQLACVLIIHFLCLVLFKVQGHIK